MQGWLEGRRWGGRRVATTPNIAVYCDPRDRLQQTEPVDRLVGRSVGRSASHNKNPYPAMKASAFFQIAPTIVYPIR
jgi:hypothetical protein